MFFCGTHSQLLPCIPSYLEPEIVDSIAGDVCGVNMGEGLQAEMIILYYPSKFSVVVELSSKAWAPSLEKNSDIINGHFMFHKLLWVPCSSVPLKT